MIAPASRLLASPPCQRYTLPHIIVNSQLKFLFTMEGIVYSLVHMMVRALERGEAQSRPAPWLAALLLCTHAYMQVQHPTAYAASHTAP